MHSFGLPKSFCLEFLAKQSTIANLTTGEYEQDLLPQNPFLINFKSVDLWTAEQVQLLKNNIEDLYNNLS